MSSRFRSVQHTFNGQNFYVVTKSVEITDKNNLVLARIWINPSGFLKLEKI